MNKNEGFVSIFSLIVMGIILISSLFLLNISKLEYLITNSNRDSIQSYYGAESKVYLILGEKRYYDELLPQIKKYLKFESSINEHYYGILIDKADLIEEDKINKVDIKFSNENNRRILEFKTKSSCNGIISQIISKATIINDFYELGIPIVSENTISIDEINNYKEYIDLIQKNIKISNENSDIMEIDATGYENVNIIKGADGKIHIELFRNNILEPIKKYSLKDEHIFFIAKNTNKDPINIFIESENGVDSIFLEGVFYIEGNLKIHNNTEFQGILIINKGNLFIEPLIDFKVKGLVLLKDYVGEKIEEQHNIEVNYNEKIIKQNGLEIPGFIDTKIYLIKGN